MRNKVQMGVVALVAIGFVQVSGVAVAAPDICTVSSIQLDGATPGTVDADGSVVAGSSVNIKGTVTQKASGTGCSAGTAGAAVNEGGLRIQEQRQAGFPSACKAQGVGSFLTQTTANLPNTTPPGTNAAAYDLDTTSLAGAVRGFRSDYTPLNPGGSFKGSTSVCVDLTINENVTGSPCDGYGDVVVLRVIGGAGQGIVMPGDVGPWSYTFEVLNCTTIDALAIKVQGGTSGWTVFDSVGTAPVAEPVNVVAKSNGKKGTTSTVTWHTVLNDEESKTITVGVDGVIPKAKIGDWLNLSGAWSAAYNNGLPQKSDYTANVYVEIGL